MLGLLAVRHSKTYVGKLEVIEVLLVVDVVVENTWFSFSDRGVKADHPGTDFTPSLRLLLLAWLRLLYLYEILALGTLLPGLGLWGLHSN